MLLLRRQTILSARRLPDYRVCGIYGMIHDFKADKESEANIIKQIGGRRRRKSNNAQYLLLKEAAVTFPYRNKQPFV